RGSGHLRARRVADSRGENGEDVRGRRALAPRTAERDRRPQHRLGRRHRAGAEGRRAGGAGLRDFRESVREGNPDPHDRRHDRAVAAADHRAGAHRPARHYAVRADQRVELKPQASARQAVVTRCAYSLLQGKVVATVKITRPSLLKTSSVTVTSLEVSTHFSVRLKWLSSYPIPAE